MTIEKSIFKIDKIEATEILDSRGNPTIKVSVSVGNQEGSFAVPSGASTGIHEAHELRDSDGKGVKEVIDKIEKVIAPALLGFDVFDHKTIDQKMLELDGTKNKDNLGGNAMIGVSIACVKLAAKLKEIELFDYISGLFRNKQNEEILHLFINLINGGKHAQNDLAFQEYQIVTFTKDITEGVRISLKIQDSLEKIILDDLGVESISLGDEGGFAPKISDIRKPLKYLQQAIKENNFEDKVRIGLDVASSSFYENGHYKIDGQDFSKEALLSLYDSLIEEFNLFSIEDPFAEEDFESFKLLKEKYKDLLVIGDDLTVTNQVLLEKAIKMDSINAMIIKPNQIGTMTEMLNTIDTAIAQNIKLIVSHRSGETEDDFIADLAFGLKTFGLKAGSPRKTERMVKYNRLMKISL